MGNITFGIPRDMALEMKKKYRLKYFVETGTYKAESAIWAAGEFERVWTIENWQPYYERCRNDRCKGYKNITLVFGDSRDKLAEVVSQIDKPALFWLDAHYAGDSRREYDNPILTELDILSNSRFKNVIMIDDAHFYDAAIMKEIQKRLKGYVLYISMDVIRAEPIIKAKKAVNHGTR